MGSRSIYKILKRSIDIVISFLSILIFIPIAIIIAVLIKIDSRGSIFYLHQRLGQNRKVIKIYKFRTMVYNSDEVFKGFTEMQKLNFERNFKLDDDPRLTKLGKKLRKSSLDELPQLFNILKGEISLIGPRPIVEREVEKYGIFAHKLFTVKPGLTGYWQINGRNNTSYDERVQLDMFYIDHQSFFLDVKIALKTFHLVFSQYGAF